MMMMMMNSLPLLMPVWTQDADLTAEADRPARTVYADVGRCAAASAPSAGGSWQSREVQQSAVSLQLFRRRRVPRHLLQCSAASCQTEGDVISKQCDQCSGVLLCGYLV